MAADNKKRGRLGRPDEADGPEDQDDQDGAEHPSGRVGLDQEVARRYDPQALSRLVMRDAGRGEALDLHTRSAMEQRLGGSFSNVRLYRGPLAEEITRRYNADAVTVGSTEMVMVREGARANFQSSNGKALLAHELTHVRQQQRGLHFASRDGAAQRSSTEEEAERVEASVRAEEQGKKNDQKADKARGQREKRFWIAVKQEVLRIYKEDQEMQSTRNGEQ